jgi:hypothetical protein
MQQAAIDKSPCILSPPSSCSPCHPKMASCIACPALCPEPARRQALHGRSRPQRPVHLWPWRPGFHRRRPAAFHLSNQHAERKMKREKKKRKRKRKPCAELSGVAHLPGINPRYFLHEKNAGELLPLSGCSVSRVSATYWPRKYDIQPNGGRGSPWATTQWTTAFNLVTVIYMATFNANQRSRFHTGIRAAQRSNAYRKQTRLLGTERDDDCTIFCSFSACRVPLWAYQAEQSQMATVVHRSRILNVAFVSFCFFASLCMLLDSVLTWLRK